LFCRQCPVIQPGFLDLAGQECVSSAGVAHAEEDMAALCRVCSRLAVAAGRNVPAAVRLAVAINADAAILCIDDVDMNQVALPCRLAGPIEIACSLEAGAAGDPLAGLSFAIDDRVEDLAILALDAHHSAAALLQRREGHPGFERLRPEIAYQRRSADKSRLAIEFEPAMFDDRAANERAMQTADAVASIALERPAGGRL